MIYLSANKGIFSDADIGALAGGLIDIILYALVGFAVAMLIVYYCKIIAGKGVRLLLENEAFSPETAKSLEELGIVKNAKFHSSRLEKSVPQSRICVCIGDAPKKYYIPEENRSRAQRTYTVNEKPLGTTVVSIVLIAVVFGVIYFTKDLIVEKVQTLANSITATDSGGQKTEDGFEYFPDKEEQELPDESGDINETESAQDDQTPAGDEKETEEDSDTEEQNEQS